MPSQEALKHGQVSESLSMIEDAVAMAQRAYVPDQTRAPLLRTRAITNLRGVESHISGSGARVEVKVAGPRGELSIHRAPGCVSSFGGSPARLEIGLGDAQRIVSVRIAWPVSGTTDIHEDVPLDARVRATEGSGELERLP